MAGALGAPELGVQGTSGNASEACRVFQVILTVRQKPRRGVMSLGSQKTVSSKESSVSGAVSRSTGISEGAMSHGRGQELGDKAGLIHGKGL